MAQEYEGHVEVYTRYGGRHLASTHRDKSRYDALGRHFTLCYGTSSWTLESWDADEADPHPLGKNFKRDDQELCRTCIAIATGTAPRPSGAVESEKMKTAFAKALEEEG